MKSHTLWINGVLSLLILFLPGLNHSVLTAQQESAHLFATTAHSELKIQENSPVYFVENVGQFEPQVRFKMYWGEITGHLTDREIWLSMPGTQENTIVNLKFSFPNANPEAYLEPFRREDFHLSFFRGPSADRGHGDVPIWRGVRYVNLYPGVQLTLSSSHGQWDPFLTYHGSQGRQFLSHMQLEVEGAKRLSLNSSKDLLVETEAGNWVFPLFAIEENSNYPAVIIETPLIQEKSPGVFNVTRPFTAVKDPLSVSGCISNTSLAGSWFLFYSTFLGGEHWDRAYAIAVDAAGYTYITGETSSIEFPTTPGVFDSVCGTTESCGNVNWSDAFVVKLNPDGTGLEYATFLGGAASEGGQDIAVDSSGNAYITGETWSEDFPVTFDAWDTTCDDGNTCSSDVFVTKLNATGTELIYSTYLGGDKNDAGFGLAVDATGNTYVTGKADSSNFPTTSGALDSVCNTMGVCDWTRYDAFVTQLNSGGTALVYSTFLGGDGRDRGASVALDAFGHAYVVGSTDSHDFPVTPDAFDSEPDIYNSDAFVVKVDVDGSNLVYATYLGSASHQDRATDVVVDAAGLAHVVGSTGGGFPTTSEALDQWQNGDEDAFALKMNQTGTELLYSTYLGGSGKECYFNKCSIALDNNGNTYVAGQTQSHSFDYFDGYVNGPSDAFLLKLNSSGSELIHGSFIGGSSGECSYGCTLEVDSLGNVYLTGMTNSHDFLTTSDAFDRVCGTDSTCNHDGSDPLWDAFVVKVGDEPTYSISGSILDDNNFPVANVSVFSSLVGGQRATTDASGDYVLSNLTAGEYTVQPVKRGWTFTPATRTVSVPPDLTNVDFVGVTPYRDSDGDGLLDTWETHGYDANGDGWIDVDLPEMGADPLHKDIFVEIDYMVNLTSSSYHSHQPKDRAIALIVYAFHDAPVNNPDGTQGIHLHVDYGPEAPLTWGESATWGGLSQSEWLYDRSYIQDPNTDWDWSGFSHIKDVLGHFAPERSKIFHYALFASHLGGGKHPTISGSSRNKTGSVAEFREGASDFVVTLGRWENKVGSVSQQAGTFMHELGHNLGLMHGGNEPFVLKPNYLSVMNRSFQMTGLIKDGQDGLFDYSRFELPPLNENALDETVGLNGGSPIANYGTRYECWLTTIPNYKNRRVAYANDPIDWNCSAIINDTAVSTDVNSDTLKTTLMSWNDWEHLVYDGGDIGIDIDTAHKTANTGQAISSLSMEEMTYDEYVRLERPYDIILQGPDGIVLPPGTQTSLPFSMTNVGSMTATLLLTTDSTDNWMDAAALPYFQSLAPSQTVSYPLTFTIPITTEVSRSHTVITATVEEASRIVDTQEIDLHVGLVAWYLTSPVNGQVPHTLVFTDTSIGQVDSWLWDFGDGHTSVEQHPEHVYQQPGIYTVTLTASGPYGSNTYTRQRLVRTSIIYHVYLPLITKE